MSYINIVSLKESTLPGLRRLFPHMSFPAAGPDAETLARINHAEIVETEPPIITETQTVAEGPAALVEGEWRQTWMVTDLPAEEYAARVQAAKDAAILQARDACQTAMTQYATRFPDLERQTWERQLAEAKAIMAGDAEPTIAKYPTIGGIIAVTGESFADFAAAVVKNDEDWTAVGANLAGQRQKIVAQIKAATTVAEVEAVPVVITVG